MYFDGVLFLCETGADTVLGVEVVRCRHAVQTRGNSIDFFASIMIEVRDAEP